MSDPDCTIHIKRVDDLEHRVEAHHVRIHKQDSILTEVKTQAGLLDMDFNHHQRDMLKSLEAQRDATIELRRSIEALAALANEDREKRLALEAKVNHHSTSLKWLLTSATAVAVGSIIAAVNHMASRT